MTIGVVQFPGSNCDQDCLRAIRDGLGIRAEYVWHKETSVDQFAAIILPGGFSYGDYLRCGAIARFSPIMRAVIAAAENGLPVLGVCNGFQILCESGLLPGALIRNQGLQFVCRPNWLRVETTFTSITQLFGRGALIQMPVAHGDGAYYADDATLRDLAENDQIVFRYVTATGEPTPEANPNGSVANIAGICNRQRNVIGLMPHPDRAWEPRLGSVDGRLIFQSLVDSLVAAA